MQHDLMVRRLEDGSVDFDAYKRSAVRGRRAAKRRYARLLLRTVSRWANGVAASVASLGATMRQRALASAHFGHHRA